MEITMQTSYSYVGRKLNIQDSEERLKQLKMREERIRLEIAQIKRITEKYASIISLNI